MSPEFEAMTIRQRQDALIAALRSGSYEQTRKTLRKDNAFCCLGVACDLTGEEWVGARIRGMWGVLPDAFIDAYQFNGDNGMHVSGSSCMAEVNDNGADFEEIADLLEPMDSPYWKRAEPDEENEDSI